MKKKFIITVLLLCVCLSTISSGCFALATYNMIFENNSYDLEQDYHSIKIDTITANVTFIHSNTSQSKVFCNELKTQKHEVEVVDGTLTITQKKNEEWYGQVLNLTSSYIVIHLNKIQYDTLDIVGVNTDVDMQAGFIFNNVNIQNTTGNTKWKSNVVDTFAINTQTGDLDLQYASFHLVDIQNTTGDVNLLNCSATSHTVIQLGTGNLTVTNSGLNLLHVKIQTGYATLNDVFASDQIMILITTGNISLFRSDAGKLELATTTGDIFASLLSSKKISTQTVSGQISIPETQDGGMCKTKTTTGNITIIVISSEI